MEDEPNQPCDTNDEGSRGMAYKRELHQAYRAERSELIETAVGASERYDKNVLYVGAGALAISLTFIEKVSPHPAGLQLSILALSWLSLVASILCHLLAQWSSQRAISRQIDILDNDYRRYFESDTPEAEVARGSIAPTNPYSKRTAFFSTGAMALVLAGVALLCIFSIVSIGSKQETNNDAAHHSQAASTPLGPNAKDEHPRDLRSTIELAPAPAPSTAEE